MEKSIIFINQADISKNSLKKVKKFSILINFNSMQTILMILQYYSKRIEIVCSDKAQDHAGRTQKKFRSKKARGLSK